MDKGNELSVRALRPRLSAVKICLSENRNEKSESLKRKKKRRKPLSLDSSFDSEDSETVAPLKKSYKKRTLTKNDGIKPETKLFPIFQSLSVKSMISTVNKESVTERNRNSSQNRKSETLKSQKSCDDIVLDSDDPDDFGSSKLNGRSLRKRKPTAYAEVEVLTDNESTSDGDTVHEKIYPLFELSQTKKTEVEAVPTRKLNSKCKVKMKQRNTEALDVIEVSSESENTNDNCLPKKIRNFNDSINKSITPLHPMFLSALIKQKCNNEHLNDESIKNISINLSIVENKKKVLDNQDNIEARKSELISDVSKKLTDVKTSVAIEQKESNFHRKNPDTNIELCYPTINHVKQIKLNSCESLENYRPNDEYDIKIKENPESEYISKSFWNGVIGLINNKAVKYLNDLKIETENQYNNLPRDDKIPAGENYPLNIVDKTDNDTSLFHNSDLAWSNINFDINYLTPNSSIEAVQEWLEIWKQRCLNWSSLETTSNSDSDSDYSDDELGKAIIIYGQPGTGKTSIVNSLASRLGFKALEVNASSTRTGKQITSQLQEAFHSHHVQKSVIFNNSKPLLNENIVIKDDITNSKDKLKPSSKRIRSNTKKPDLKENKLIKEDNIQVSKRKNITSFFTKVKDDHSDEHVESNTDNSDDQKSHPKCKTIANFFSKVKKSENQVFNDVRSKIISSTSTTTAKVNLISEKTTITSNNEKSTLILFDDVDVVFEEDEGFWCAVNTFLKTSKRPVIFTASRNLEIFSNNLNNTYQVINFNNNCPTLSFNKELEQLSNKVTIGKVFRDLMILNANDLRKSLLQLQFWVKERITSISHGSKKSEPNDTLHSAFFSLNNPFCDSHTFSKELHHILFSSDFVDLYNLIMYHYSMDFDLLYENLFNVSSCTKVCKWQPMWNSTYDHYLDTYMTKNENFYRSGSSECVEDNCSTYNEKLLVSLSYASLKHVALVLDDFSYSDVLKSQFKQNNFHWLSTKERLKQWSVGLPTCLENSFPLLETTCLDIICTINFLSIRKYYQTLNFQVEPDTKETLLDTDASLDTLSPNLNSSDHNDLQNVLLVLPVIHHLHQRPVILDYLSFIRYICKEEAKRKTILQRSRRFLHYLDAASFPLNTDDFV